MSPTSHRSSSRTASPYPQHHPAPAPVDAGGLTLQEVIQTAWRAGASDVFIQPGRAPAFRLEGSIKAQEKHFPVLSGENTHRLLFAVLNADMRAQIEGRLEGDFALSFTLEGSQLIRLRGNLQFQVGGWGGVFRLIPGQIPTPDAIGLEPVVEKLAHLPRGLVLLTGPTGCGKSTTLACLVERINQTYDRHILTIEDPIEYLYTPIRCQITQRELGTHTHGFAPALRSALRADPDVLLVGEMRDLETIQLALSASETGHLVFSTLHTTDAAQTVDRIIDVFPAGQQPMVRGQLSAVLQAVVSQVLLPRIDKPGRIAAREILLANAAVRTLIREENTHQIYSALSSGAATGMTSLEASLAAKVKAGQLSPDIALAAANRPAVLQSLFSRATTGNGTT